MHVFLIRHAQSANNAKPESERIPDPPITEVGQTQAGHLAEWITSLGLTRLVTSPFLRTLQTARRIHASTGLPAEVRPEWHEHGGCYSGYLHGQLRGEPGMNAEEIQQRFPEFQVAEEIDHQGWWRRRPWETVSEARQRAERVAQQTRDEFAASDERVAFVTHADFKRFFVESIHDQWIDTPINTSVTTIEITPAQTRVVEYNSVVHLPAELRTE